MWDYCMLLWIACHIWQHHFVILQFPTRQEHYSCKCNSKTSRYTLCMKKKLIILLITSPQAQETIVPLTLSAGACAYSYSYTCGQFITIFYYFCHLQHRQLLITITITMTITSEKWFIKCSPLWWVNKRVNWIRQSKKKYSKNKSTFGSGCQNQSACGGLIRHTYVYICICMLQAKRWVISITVCMCAIILEEWI